MQSKFPLADVLLILAALCFGFVCFLSSYFYTLGNTAESLILSVSITVLLGGTVFIAGVLKRTNRNFKIKFVLEIIMLILFTGLFVFFTYTVFFHFFSVSDKKNEVQNQMKKSIAQAEDMFSKYEFYVGGREKLYKNTLQSVVGAKVLNPETYSSYGFVSTGVSDQKQIDNKMFTLHAKLFPSNYSDTTRHKGIKEVATKWLDNAKNITSTWNPIGIVKTVTEVENNSNEWLHQLTTFSKARGQNERANDFGYILTFDNVKTHFTTDGKTSPVPLGLAVLAYLLMLLSYLITKRSTKSAICKTENKGEFDIEF